MYINVNQIILVYDRELKSFERFVLHKTFFKKERQNMKFFAELKIANVHYITCGSLYSINFIQE